MPWVVAVALWTAGCAPGPRADHVVLVTVDTLRADRLGLAGYERPTTPSIDAFFGEGAIFERAYSTDSNTPPSVVSILTGQLPQEHGVRVFYQLLPETTRILTDWLPDEMQTAAFVSNLVLTDEALGLAARFDHFDDYVDRRESERPYFERIARDTTDAALRWLAEDRDPERPFFLWVHYIDPHGPYRPPEDAPQRFTHEGRREMRPSRVMKYMREANVHDGLAYVDRYDEEVAYVDEHVGRLLTSIPSSEDTVFVLTADHGESMMDHERWFRHGYSVYEELVRVPLLVRGPGISAERRETPVSVVDIVPTVLNLLGQPVPDTVRGVDLFSSAARDGQRTIYFEAFDAPNQHRAVVQGDTKWMGVFRGRQAKPIRRWLYRLDEDPSEQNASRWAAEREGGLALMDLVRSDPDPGGYPAEYRKGSKIDAPKISPRAGAEALERLRALGYVE